MIYTLSVFCAYLHLFCLIPYFWCSHFRALFDFLLLLHNFFAASKHAFSSFLLLILSLFTPISLYITLSSILSFPFPPSFLLLLLCKVLTNEKCGAARHAHGEYYVGDANEPPFSVSRRQSIHLLRLLLLSVIRCLLSFAHRPVPSL